MEQNEALEKGDNVRAKEIGLEIKEPPGRQNYFCPVWLPESLVPEEFVMGPAPAVFGGTLDPWPMPMLSISASAVF